MRVARTPAAVLRDARWTDVPVLVGLEAAVFPDDAWSERSWWAELAGRPRRDYVVAERVEGPSPAGTDRAPGGARTAGTEAETAGPGGPVAGERVGPGGPLLGYGGLDHAGEVADVMTVVVAPEGRGTGVGRALLSELEDRAAARGAGHVVLEVRADNARAVGLYTAAGYTTVSTRPRYYQPGDVDALVMRKSLRGSAPRKDDRDG